MKRLTGLFVLTAFLFSACEQVEKQEIPQFDKGVSKRLNDSRKQSIGNILYTLILNVPSDENEAIKGGEQIDFQLKKNEGPLALDFNAPAENILKVEVNGIAGHFSFENGHIILPQKDLKEGNNQLKIDFIVDGKSVTRNEDFLYSNVMSNGASSVFPCFDQPNLKALFSLNLMLKPGWAAVSNAPVNAVNEGAERVLYQFANTKPISTDLFGFAAGDFETVSKERKGRKANIYYLKTDSEKFKENEEYLFDLQLNALEWMEAYTKIAYPFQKFDLLLLPSLEKDFISQPGLVCIQFDKLLITDKPTAKMDLKRARLIARGTAQMWFGNLVSINWYDDFWLTDVLTAYISAKMVEPSFTTIYHDLEFLTNHFPKALAVDRSSGNHPIQQSCNNSADAELLAGPIASHKAPIIFRQLEKILSEERMRAGLIDYLKKYSFSNAGWDELINVFDGKTHDDLKSWSNIWFKEPGMPEYKAFQEFDLYVINQYDQNRNDIIWPQSLDLYKKWSENWQHKEVWDDVARFEFPIGDFVDIVIMNWHGYAYGYFFQNLREKNFLLSKRMFELDPIRRGVSYISLWENLVRGNLLPLEMREAMKIYFEKEIQIANIELLESYYEQMFWRFSNQQQREQWAQIMEPLLWGKYKDADTPAKEQAYYEAFIKTAITEGGIQKMLALWKGNTDRELTEEEKTVLAAELSVRKKLPAGKNIPGDIITKQKEQTNSVILQSKLDVLSMVLNNPENGLTNLEEGYLLSETQFALHYLHHPLASSQSETYVLPSIDLVNEIDRGRNKSATLGLLQASLNGYRTQDIADTIAYYLGANAHLHPKFVEKLRQAVDPVQRAAQLELDFETEVE